MAEVTAFRNNATDFPIYGLPWTIVFPLLDADGDPVTGATCDSEISLNGDTGADCTNEGTEITFTTATNKGMYYLTLTAAEMTCDIASITIYSATSKATPIVLYPKKLPILLTSDNAGAYDSTTTINLGSSASAIDDFYNGCIVYIYGGTGNGQVRMITDYVGSTKLATVHVAWATNPDTTSDLKVYRTEQNPYGIGYAKEATLTEMKGSGFSATTDTLEKLADAIAAVPAATGVPIFYYPTAATRTVGDNDGGAFTDLAAEDGTYFATGEVNTGAFLDVTITCATADTTNHPAAVYAPGYYNGDGAHRIDVYRWDYELSAWEAVKAYSMLPRTSEFGYRCGLYPRNVSVTGEVKLRFVHAGSASGNPSHALNLDMIELEFSPVDSETPTALAQIFTLLQDVDNEVDGLVTSVDALPTAAEVVTALEAGDFAMDTWAWMFGVAGGGGTETLTYTRTDAKTLTSSNVDGNGNRPTAAVRSA